MCGLYRMARMILIILCCACFLFFDPVNSLKCRTDNHQTNDQFWKAIQVCRKRHLNHGNENDDFSPSDSDDNDDTSDIDIFDENLFIGNNLSNMQSNKRNRGNNRNNNNDQRYSFNYTNGNWKNAQYPNRGSNSRFGYSDEIRSSYNQMYARNSENYKEQEQACAVQCFFDELNTVDPRGFPEQQSVIQLMTHNIQNSELQDFIEEAIIECFRYLNTDMKRDKCYFSQNILYCLADKGKEGCEDWNN